MILATIEDTHDDGSPATLRDEYGLRWRVAADAMDGTLAVEEIPDQGGDHFQPLEDLPAGRCAVARWHRDGTVALYLVRDYGENQTEPKTYEAGSDVWGATLSGWQPLEEEEED